MWRILAVILIIFPLTMMASGAFAYARGAAGVTMTMAHEPRDGGEAAVDASADVGDPMTCDHAAMGALCAWACSPAPAMTVTEPVRVVLTMRRLAAPVPRDLSLRGRNPARADRPPKPGLL